MLVASEKLDPATLPVVPLQQSHARVPGLDVLRGAAVLIVVVNHLAQVTFLPNGTYPLLGKIADRLWIGVDIFFVLSGFLITSGLIASKPRPHYYQSFYIKRAFRLLPIYYLTFFSFLCLPLVWRSRPSLWLVLGYVFYVQNWAMAAGYWIKGTAHFWSLAIEEQYYMFWPWFAKRFNSAQLLRVALGLWAGSFLLRAGLRYSVPIEGWPLYTLTVTRLDGIALGSAIALAWSEPKWAKALTRRIDLLFWTFSLVLALAVAYLPEAKWNVDTITYLPLFASLWSGCALVFIVQRHWDPGGPISFVLQRFGLYSYSIYVLHPFLTPLLAAKTGGRFSLDLPAYLRPLPPISAAFLIAAVFIIFLGMCYGFGEIVYRAFELPLFALRKRALAELGEARLAAPPVRETTNA